jgi:hypothetical protein
MDGELDLTSDEEKFLESVIMIFRKYHNTVFSSTFNFVFDCDLKNESTFSSMIRVLQDPPTNSVTYVRDKFAGTLLPYEAVSGNRDSESKK